MCAGLWHQYESRLLLRLQFTWALNGLVRVCMHVHVSIHRDMKLAKSLSDKSLLTLPSKAINYHLIDTALGCVDGRTFRLVYSVAICERFSIVLYFSCNSLLWLFVSMHKCLCVGLASNMYYLLYHKRIRGTEFEDTAKLECLQPMYVYVVHKSKFPSYIVSTSTADVITTVCLSKQ